MTTCRPILFSGAMVRALLAGTKTQTRRTVKVQQPPEARCAGVIHSATDSNGVWSWLDAEDLEDASFIGKDFRCPYGVPGDELWVRETQYVFSAGYKDGSGRNIVYRATEPDAPCTWTPSIHMPRWASRITLRITDVRIQRLQDISEEDAESEGTWNGLHEWSCVNGHFPDPAGYCVNGCGSRSAVETYRALWESINGVGSWAINPWVWALTFERATEVAAP